MSARQPPTDGGVGCGRPPVHSQFKPGQSGNPKGRPKQSKNVDVLVRKEANQPVYITENGRRRKVSKAELIIKSLFNRAARPDCDPRMALAVVRLLFTQIAETPTSIPEAALGGGEDQELVRTFLARIKDQTNEPE